MRAVTWQGKRKVSVDEVPDPTIEDPHDAIIEVSSSGLCGSDLHLYEILGPFLHPGDVLGHEPMGRVVEKGSSVTNLQIGDRVVVPFQIACGHCYMCQRGLQTQCESTQVRKHRSGAALFGYTDLYGAVPGAQAEYLRVPYANYGPIKVPDGPPDDRFVFLSDVAPTAWQGVEYAGVGADDTLVVLGLGPIGEMACRIALRRGVRVIGIDLVPARLQRSASLGVQTIDLRTKDVPVQVRDLTDGRGADAVLDAVGLEAHGSPVAAGAQFAAGVLPDAVARQVMLRASVDRLGAFELATELVRRGGVISLSGVYAGVKDPVDLKTLFDKQVTLRMGQANVRNWIDDLLPLATDSEDPLGFEGFATHHASLNDAPSAYAAFQKKDDDMIKLVFNP